VQWIGKRGFPAGGWDAYLFRGRVVNVYRPDNVVIHITDPKRCMPSTALVPVNRLEKWNG
jgi:hypothetical protein